MTETGALWTPPWRGVGRADRRAGAAPHLSVAALLAASAGAHVLAHGADDHLGPRHHVPRHQQLVGGAGSRGPARRRHPVGRDVPRPDRALPGVHRRDVVAQSRPSLREPLAPVGADFRAHAHQPDPHADRHGGRGGLCIPALRVLDLRSRLRADRLLREPDRDGLGRGLPSWPAWCCATASARKALPGS